jgi:hypothetical protein
MRTLEIDDEKTIMEVLILENCDLIPVRFKNLFTKTSASYSEFSIDRKLLHRCDMICYYNSVNGEYFMIKNRFMFSNAIDLIKKQIKLDLINSLINNL